VAWNSAILAELRPPGLKPGVILIALRGAKAPLFHGGVDIDDARDCDAQWGCADL
jgi:hypothetical protein